MSSRQNWMTRAAAVISVGSVMAYEYQLRGVRKEVSTVSESVCFEPD